VPSSESGGTLLIAERFNLLRTNHANLTAELYALLHARDYAAYCERMLEVSCFWDGVGREKLLSLGARWDDAMNLAPPAAQGSPWPSVLARVVGGYVATEIAPRYSRVILVGRNVATALGLPRGWPFFEPRERYLVCSHPSGLNRWWNEPTNVADGRAAVERWLAGLGFDPIQPDGAGSLSSQDWVRSI